MVLSIATTPNSSTGFNRIRNQIIACLTANIIMFAQGVGVGWLSPSLPILLSENSPLSSGTISVDEASWIGSIMCIGGITGSFVFGIISTYVGWKSVLLCCSLPITIHWILIAFSDYVWEICLARFFLGMTGGALFSFIPLFIAEIASDHVRGSLGSLMSVNISSGILLGLTLGSIVDYATLPIIGVIFPVIFFCLFFCFPSTPQYLLKRDKVEEADKSLKFYRNHNLHSIDDQHNFLIEFTKLKAIAFYNKETEALKISDFYEKDTLRGLLIGCTLMFVNVFTGSWALLNYAATIFAKSGSNIHPNTSALVLGVIQILGTLCTIAVIDRLGRKFLLLISTTGLVLCLSVTGAYSYLTEHGYDTTDYNLVPIVGLSLVVFLSAIGTGQVPYVLIAEVLPRKVRRAGALLCTTSFNIFAFALFKMFPLLLNAIGLYGCMLIFASTALFGLFFTIFVIPETKGKNLDTLECKK